MTAVEQRFRENYPMIFMTMISLIVGLLYENLVSAMRDLEGLWRGDAESFFLWSQCLLLAVVPLLFWFTNTLNSAALRAVFHPRLAIVPVLAAVGLFFFVSNLGADMAIPWLFGVAAAMALAKPGFRDFGSLYQSDPETPGGIASHRRSGNLMALVGVAIAGGGVLTLTGQIGLVGAGVVLCAGLVGVVVAHYLWYREWQSAVGFSVEDA